MSRKHLWASLSLSPCCARSTAPYILFLKDGVLFFSGKLGFYEGDRFEVGQINDITNGQTVLVRDENGWPL